IVLGTELADVPERYQDPELASRLVSVLCDAVERDGVVICPATAWEVQDYARDSDCRVAVFSEEGEVSRRDAKRASAVATVRRGRIHVEGCSGDSALGALD